MAVPAVSNLLSSISNMNAVRALQSGDNLAMKTQQRSGQALSSIAETTKGAASGTTGSYKVNISGIAKAKSVMMGQ